MKIVADIKADYMPLSFGAERNGQMISRSSSLAL